VAVPVDAGLHVGLGLVIIPVVLAKLWSVIPRLFAWPPARSLAQLLERVTLLMLVGGILFEIVTGILNIQYDYVFGFDFYTAHYFGAWVFIAGFVCHLCLKLPTMVRSLRSRSMRSVLGTSRADTVPEPPDPTGLVALDPDPPTLSRRGALALVGGGTLLPGGAHRRADGGWVHPQRCVAAAARTQLWQRAQRLSNQPHRRAAGIDTAASGPSWRLELLGAPRPVLLDRAALQAMEQHTVELPIACVEGWSTTQTWTGIRLADLAAAAGRPRPGSALVVSMERFGAFNRAVLAANQILDPDALLALRVNGADLSLDHGYPTTSTPARGQLSAVADPGRGAAADGVPTRNHPTGRTDLPRRHRPHPGSLLDTLAAAHCHVLPHQRRVLHHQNGSSAAEKGSLIKSDPRTAIALFGGATILVLAAGCVGGYGKSKSTTTTTPTTTTSSSVTPAPPPAATPGGPAGGAFPGRPIMGCYIGLNCGCIPHLTCPGSARRRPLTAPPPTPPPTRPGGGPDP
jgi:DMSO/TMAO reductase YedYZ molybdopterin-dependent catalytic subunit